MTPRIKPTSLLLAAAIGIPLAFTSGVASAAPPKPTGVVCQASGTGRMDVSNFSVWDFTTTDIRDALSGQTWTLSFDEVGAPYDATLTGLDPNRRYQLQIRYTDSDGTSAWSKLCDPTYARPSVGNRVLNPSADLGLKYWYGNNGTLSLNGDGSPGWGGKTSIRITRATGATYGLTDFAPGTVPTVPAAGKPFYEAAAWVKAATPSAVGKPVTIALQERTPSGASVRVTDGASATLSSDWQQVWVTAKLQTRGDTLGVSVQQRQAASGDALAVDDIRVHPFRTVVRVGEPQTSGPVDPNVKRATAVDLTPCSQNAPVLINCDREYDLTGYSAYVDGQAGGTGSASIRGVIYTDAGNGPGALIAATRSVVVKAGRAPGWVNLPLSSPVELGSRVYWFGYQVGGANNIVRFYGDSDTVYCSCSHAKGIWTSDAYADGPSNTFGPLHDAGVTTMVRGTGGR